MRMMRFLVSLQGVIVADSDEDVEEHLDQVMEELMHLRTCDPSIDAGLADGSVCISVVVDSSNPLDAITQASGSLRSAIHAAGGGTADWPGPTHEAWSMRLLHVRAGAIDDTEDEPVPSDAHLVNS